MSTDLEHLEKCVVNLVRHANNPSEFHISIGHWNYAHDIYLRYFSDFSERYCDGLGVKIVERIEHAISSNRYELKSLAKEINEIRKYIKKGFVTCFNLGERFPVRKVSSDTIVFYDSARETINTVWVGEDKSAFTFISLYVDYLNSPDDPDYTKRILSARPYLLHEFPELFI